MVITPHALIGFLIATDIEKISLSKDWHKKRRNTAILTCLLAFISHFFLDAIPHFDYHLGTPLFHLNFASLIPDILLTAAVFYFLFIKNMGPTKIDHTAFFLTMFAAAISSMLPDILLAISDFTNLPYINWFGEFHDWCHSKKDVSMWLKASIEICLSLATAYMLYISRNRLIKNLAQYNKSQ